MKTKVEKSIDDFVRSKEFEDTTYLSDREKEVMRFKVLDDLSFVEIGNYIQRSGARVANLYFSICKKIKCITLMKLDPSLIPIQFTFLPIRMKNALLAIGLKNLNEINQMSAYQLSEMRNIGKQCIEETEKYIAPYGLALDYDYERQKRLKEFNKILRRKENIEKMIAYNIRKIEELNIEKEELMGNPHEIFTGLYKE